MTRNPHGVLKQIYCHGRSVVENVNSLATGVNPQGTHARDLFERGRQLVRQCRPSPRFYGKDCERLLRILQPWRTMLAIVA